MEEKERKKVPIWKLFGRKRCYEVRERKRIHIYSSLYEFLPWKCQGLHQNLENQDWI
jgi:hypothetical protein